MSAQGPADMSAIRDLLQAELDSLLGRLREMEDSSRREMQAQGARPGFGKRVGDYTSEAMEAAKNSAVARNLGKSLQELERALEKIEEGTYGVCDVCHHPIDPERLELLPSSALCVECKRKREQTRRGAPWRPPSRRRG